MYISYSLFFELLVFLFPTPKKGNPFFSNAGYAIVGPSTPLTKSIATNATLSQRV